MKTTSPPCDGTISSTNNFTATPKSCSLNGLGSPPSPAEVPEIRKAEGR